MRTFYPVFLLLLFLLPLGFFLPFLNTDFYAEDLPTLLSLSRSSWKQPFNIYLSEGADAAEHTALQGMLSQKTRYFRPLLPFVLFAVQKVAGLRPFVYRTANLSLHIACGWLIFLLLARWTGNLWLSAGFALFFLIHPGRSFPVMKIVTLSTLLALFFSLLSVCVLERRSSLALLSSSAFLFLALLSKETAFLFPIGLMLYGHLVGSERKMWRLVASLWLFYILLRIFFAASFYPEQTCPPYYFSPFQEMFWQNFFRSIGTYTVYSFLFFVPPQELANIWSMFPRPLASGTGFICLSLFLLERVVFRQNGIRTTLILLFLLLAFLPASLTQPSLTELYYPAGWLSLYAGLAFSHLIKKWSVRSIQIISFLGILYFFLLGAQLFKLNGLYQKNLASGPQQILSVLSSAGIKKTTKRIYLVNIPSYWVLGTAISLQQAYGGKLKFFILTLSSPDDSSRVSLRLYDRETIFLSKPTGFLRTPIERSMLCGKEKRGGAVYKTPAFSVYAMESPPRTIKVVFNHSLTTKDAFLIWYPSLKRGELWLLEQP